MNDRRGLLYLNCLYNVVYAKYLLSFWEFGTLVCAKQRCLRDQRPVKTLGAKSLTSFPSRKLCTCCHNSFAGGMKCTLCKAIWRGLLEDRTGFSLELTTSLASADFPLYPLTVINLGHENKYMLSLLSPSKEIFKHGGGFGNPPIQQTTVSASLVEKTVLSSLN